MSRVSKNIIYNVVGQLLTMLLGFVAVKLIFGDLGSDALGIIYFTTLLNSLLLMAMDMGVTSTTMREVSAHNHDEPDYIRQLIQTGSFFYWTAFLFFAFLLFMLAPILVDNWVNLTSMDKQTAIYALRVLGIASFLALPQSLYMSLFKGLQRMEFNNVINVATSMLRQFGTIIILANSGNLFHVIYLHVFSYALQVSVYIVVLLRFFPIKAFTPTLSIAVVKRNLSFASKLTLHTVILAIYGQLDKLIISKMMPLGTLGYYSFIFGNASKATFLENAITMAVYPSFCELFERGDKQRMRQQYVKFQDLLSFAIVPVFAIIPFATLPLCSFVFTSEIARELLAPAALLCLGFFMFCTIRIPVVFALACGRPEIAVKADAYALFVVLPATAILIYFFGLIGAASSMIVRRLVYYLYAIPIYCRECFEMPVKEWFYHTSKIFFLIGIAYGTAWMLLAAFDNYSILALSTAYVAATILFVVGSYHVISFELKKGILDRLGAIRSQTVEAI